MNEKIGKGIDILTRLVTLGFIETTSEVKEAVLKYQGSVEVLEKPEFDFVEGGKVMITKLKMKVTFSSYVDARIDKKISLDTSSFKPYVVSLKEHKILYRNFAFDIRQMGCR
jgi:hypothetical protein